ncbi:MAG: FAD-binding oxidoreductase [Deltaproteobacteria bacterium]|nr:MAG: FAD-binding oxidoreductase [Deltaproteobacteria bacterium]
MPRATREPRAAGRRHAPRTGGAPGRLGAAAGGPAANGRDLDFGAGRRVAGRAPAAATAIGRKDPVTPMRADVVIAGGGFAGASTAFWLSRAARLQVVVVEREAICGVHASGRNAALGRQVTEHDAFTAVAVRGATWLRRPPPDLADRPLVSGCGSLLVASREATLARLVATAHRFGVPAERVPPAAVRARWPLLDATPMVGAVWFPTDGVIDIHALLAGLLAGARSRGVRVETGCEVLGCRPAGDGVRVETSKGPIDARCLVVAAGAWAEPVGAAAGGRARFDPVLRHLHVTEPLADVPADAPFAWHVDDEFYVRPESGACLVSACDETVVAPHDPVPSPAALSVLADKLARMAPRLVEYGIARTWACLRTFSRDGGPLVAWDDRAPWLFWVAGLGGHGATASVAIGRDAAAALAARLA